MAVNASDAPTVGPMLHFGWFVGHGFGVQGWGTPGYGIGYDWKKPALYQDAVRAFERSGLDLFIIEDSLTVPDTYGGSAEVSLAQASFAPKHDPLALVPYLFSATRHLGIVPTISASFYPPFTAARLLATLQHFSHEQLGWNVVTSGSDLAAQNYGLDQQIEHDRRYEKAEEFVDVVRRLWRSWEPDAIREDAEGGRFRGPHQGPPDPPRRRVLQGPRAAEHGTAARRNPCWCRQGPPRGARPSPGATPTSRLRSPGERTG